MTSTVKKSPNSNDSAIAAELMRTNNHYDGEEIILMLEFLRRRIDEGVSSSEDLIRDCPFSLNSFTKIRYHKNEDGLVYIWPEYIPKTTFDAKIERVQPIFDHRGSVVDCSYEDKRFTFFDPNPDFNQYKRAVGSTKKIRLAAMATPNIFINNSNDPEGDAFTEKEYKEILKKGYTIEREFPFHYYGAILSVQGQEISKGNYFKINVINPIDDKSPLELIASYQEGYEKTENLTEKISAFFYLTGSLI